MDRTGLKMFGQDIEKRSAERAPGGWTEIASYGQKIAQWKDFGQRAEMQDFKMQGVG